MAPAFRGVDAMRIGPRCVRIAAIHRAGNPGGNMAVAAMSGIETMAGMTH